ncbi:MAG: hypothetical protein GXY83_26855 [Rhodopirellula sp.]|nr:hypothetical protein [Rhodopirellula sp.]
MIFRSTLSLSVLLALVAGGLAAGPGDQAGQLSITGKITAIQPKGNLIIVEPLSAAQLQTQQAAVKPGKKAGPVTILVDEQTMFIGGIGKGKPGKPGQQPPFGKQKPMPSQSKALVAEDAAVETAAPAAMIAPEQPVVPGPDAPVVEIPAPDAGPNAFVVPPTGQDRATPPPQQSQAAGKPGKPGKPTQQPSSGKPGQFPSKPMGKIGSKIQRLSVGQLVQVMYVAILPPIGPGQQNPDQAAPIQGKPDQAVPTQVTPGQAPSFGKAKPQPGQAAPSKSKAAIGSERGVTVQPVEDVQPMAGPAAPFRAVSIRILSALDRPMPVPAIEPPQEPEPPAPTGPPAPTPGGNDA